MDVGPEQKEELDHRSAKNMKGKSDVPERDWSVRSCG